MVQNEHGSKVHNRERIANSPPRLRATTHGSLLGLRLFRIWSQAVRFGFSFLQAFGEKHSDEIIVAMNVSIPHIALFLVSLYKVFVLTIETIFCVVSVDGEYEIRHFQPFNVLGRQRPGLRALATVS